jgi:hypothetical protein
LLIGLKPNFQIFFNIWNTKFGTVHVRVIITYTLLRLQMIITELLHNYIHDLTHFIQCYTELEPSCHAAYLHKLSLVSLSIWWSSQSIEERHIAFCPCPSKMYAVSWTFGSCLFIAKRRIVTSCWSSLEVYQLWFLLECKQTNFAAFFLLLWATRHNIFLFQNSGQVVSKNQNNSLSFCELSNYHKPD